jgi:hypothetical protein
MSDLALDPGWYSDRYGEQIERYHDGDRWTQRVRVPGSPVELQQAAATPMSSTLRTFLTWLICVGAFLLYWVALGFAAVGTEIPMIAYLVIWATLVIVFAPWVQTTRWWAITPLIPIIGGFVALYASKVLAHRLFYLPYRDWEPTHVDPNQWQQLAHPTKAGETIFVRRRG